MIRERKMPLCREKDDVYIYIYIYINIHECVCVCVCTHIHTYILLKFSEKWMCRTTVIRINIVQYVNSATRDSYIKTVDRKTHCYDSSL
jgi:hypothetical protein